MCNAEFPMNCSQQGVNQTLDWSTGSNGNMIFCITLLPYIAKVNLFVFSKGQCRKYFSSLSSEQIFPPQKAWEQIIIIIPFITH